MKKKSKFGKKSAPYLYFGALSKTAFYHIYLGWWIFLTIVAVYTFVSGSSNPSDIVDNISILEVEETKKHIEVLELQIAVLEEELKNRGILLEDQTANDFIKEKKNKELHEFLSVLLFSSLIVYKLSVFYFKGDV
jgi:hypothetical protein